MTTTERCNLAWPFTIKPPKAFKNIPILNACWHSNGYMTIRIRGQDGSVREWLLLVPIGAYAILGVGGTIVAMGQAGLTELVTVTTPGGQGHFVRAIDGQPGSHGAPEAAYRNRKGVSVKARLFRHVTAQRWYGVVEGSPRCRHALSSGGSCHDRSYSL
jgi:hypothetical protein